MHSALQYGHGPLAVDFFLEPTCPFSVKVLRKIPKIAEALGPETASLRLWMHSQPWHLYSGVLVRAILAAARQDPNGDSAHKVLTALADKRRSYEFEDHARGGNLDVTPRELLDRLASESGVDFWSTFDLLDLQTDIKRHTKFARQNGIHVSPTVMVGGLIENSLSSGDVVDDWVATIRKAAN